MGQDIQSGKSSGFVFATLRGDVVRHASSSWTAHLGYAAEELENRSLKAFVHADDWLMLNRFIATCVKTGEAQAEIVFRFRHKDGSWRHFVATVSASEKGIGEAGTLLFVSRDVTERKKLEAKMEQDKTLLRTILDIVPAFISIRNLEGRYILINEAGAAFFGLTVAEATGRLALEISPNKEKLPGFLAVDRDAIATGKPGYFPEEIVKNKAGKTCVLETYMVPLVVDNEPAVLFVSQDQSERNKLEKERRELRDSLHHADRMGRGGEMAMALAHEINQPLTAILSNAQAAQLMLEGGKPDWAELGAILADIVADDKRAGNVIRRLRSFLKKQTPFWAVVDVNEAVMEILLLIRADSALKDVTVTTNLAAPAPKIFADRVQVQQVVLNLVMNAGEAMAAQPPGDRNVTVATLRDDAGAVVISVSDTGPGIPRGAQERLFEAHFTTKPNGMGMGLAICRSIAEAHGGRIWAVNNPEGGATLSVSLPAAKKEGANLDLFASRQRDLFSGGARAPGSESSNRGSADRRSD